jgi:hypothetical protein
VGARPLSSPGIGRLTLADPGERKLPWGVRQRSQLVRKRLDRHGHSVGRSLIGMQSTRGPGARGTRSRKARCPRFSRRSDSIDAANWRERGDGVGG